MPRLTPDVIEEFIARWNRGDSNVALCSHFHVGADRIADMAQRIRAQDPERLRRRLGRAGRPTFADARSL